MILNVISWKNHKAGFFSHPSFTKDDPAKIEEAYVRLIKTDITALPKELKDCSAVLLGTFDDVACTFDLIQPKELFNVANLILDNLPQEAIN